MNSVGSAASLSTVSRYLVLACAGALASLSHGIINFWPLSLVGMAGLFWVIRQQTPRQAFVSGMVFGICHFVIGVGWLFISMHRFGGMPSPLAAGGVLALSGLLACFGATACALAQNRYFAQNTALAFAGFWALLEWLRSWVLSGFPWLSLGYSQLDGPFQFAAQFVGVFGISALACLAATCLAGMVQHRIRLNSILGLIGVVIGCATLSFFSDTFTRADGKPFSVRLLQGNVPQNMKFNPSTIFSSMTAYANEIAQSPASLTVTPETAWAMPWDNTPVELRQALLSAVASGGTRLALGIPWNDKSQYFNSVVFLDKSADTKTFARYDKQHLVPFGEYVPWGFRWFVNQMQIPLGDFGQGNDQQALLDHQGRKLAFNICYEDLFGELLAGQVRQGAQVLVNISNIAWFGDSHALPQHLAISRMRSLELGRPMLRSTNTGATAHIDARGKPVQVLEFGKKGNLDATVQGHSGLTPYARFGNYVSMALALALICLALRRQRSIHPVQ